MDGRSPLELMGEEPAGDVLSNEDLTEATADGLRWIAYSRVATELALFGSMVVLARLIPPGAFGVFAVIVIVQELALTLPMEGVGGALVQRKSIDRGHLQAGLALSLAVSAGLGLITVVLALVLVRPLFGEQTAVLMIATTPYFLLGAIYAVPMAVLRRRLDFRRMSFIEITMNASRAFVTLGLAIVGLDAPALVFGAMAGMAVAVLLALIFAPVPLPWWHAEKARDLLPYGGPAAAATVAWAGFRNGDYAVIGATLGATQAGIYWRAYQLAVEYQRKVAVAMTQMAFPVLARTAGQEELLALRQRMVQLLTVVLFPLLAMLFLLAPVVVPWMFGSAWSEAVVPTQILVAGGAATLVIDACGSSLMAIGRTRALLGYGIAHFAVYVGVVLALVHLGLPAVAVGGASVHVLFLGVAYVVMLRGQVRSPLLVLWQDTEPALVSLIGLAALAIPANWALTDAGLSVVPCVAGTAIAASAGYLIALRVGFPASSRDLGSAVRRILPDRLTSWLPRGRAALAES
jgi:O-antigen/teichoic acid export membrane protein